MAILTRPEEGEGGSGVSQDLVKKHYGAVYHSGHPAFVDELFLSSARDIKILKVICFMLCVRIVCKRKTTLCFNDKVMLLIKPSWN